VLDANWFGFIAMTVFGLTNGKFYFVKKKIIINFLIGFCTG